MSTRATDPVADHSESMPGVPLEAVLCTDALNRRPSRTRILDAFQCDSAGVSLVNEQETRFDWPAIAGVWKPHIGGGTPRHFGPCGDVLRHARCCSSISSDANFIPVTPAVDECLLVPFSVDGKAVGTIWAITRNKNSAIWTCSPERPLI